MSLIQDPDLSTVLQHADADDLVILIDHITDKGRGRISLSSEVFRRFTAARDLGLIDQEVRALLAEELQRFGGNSVANLLRGGSGVFYKEIVSDVADHVKALYSQKNECFQIETAILLKVLEQSLEKMTEEQKHRLFEEFGSNYTVGAGPAATAAFLAMIRLSGIGTYKLAAVVADSVVTALLGRGLVMGASTGMMRSAGVFVGPIGWAITAIWTAFDMASPAYRVTVPCVIQIAYMRQKAVFNRCSGCEAVLQADAKFCSECGYRVHRPAELPDTA